MAPGRHATRHEDNNRAPEPLPPRPIHIIPVALAILLVVSGLLLFSQAQTQPLFQDMGNEAMSLQSPRDDGGILIGALLTIAGTTLLLCIFSPLPPIRRLLPAGVFAVAGTLLLGAHFSIFTNGITFPDREIFSVRSTYLFHDTAAIIHIATFTLAFVTLLGLLAAGFAALALLAPRMLTQNILRPRTLDGHRTRVLIVTLLLLGVGAAFARQFILFAFDAAISLETRAMAMAYLLMGGLLAFLLVLVGWRTSRILWGNLEDRLTRRFDRKHDQTLRLETGIWTMLLLFTGITLLGDPVWQPPAGTDPVFAMNSVGVSWVFLAVIGVYVTQRTLTRAYTDHLHGSETPLPRIGPDRLLALGLFVVFAWTLGGLWSLPETHSPLVALTLRLLLLVLALPLFTLRWSPPQWRTTTDTGKTSLMLSWTVLSALTGIMLWGIGNGVDIRFSSFNGGLLDPGGRLFEGISATVRLLGSLLLVVPVILLLRLLAKENGRRQPVGMSLLAAIMGIFTLHVLFTITSAIRQDPFTGKTVLFVSTWSNSLATPTDVMVIGILVSLTTAMGMICSTRLLQRSAESVPYPLPIGEWLHSARAKIRGPSAIRQREQQARMSSRTPVHREE